MSKEEDIKFLKIQTCVLRVNIHCDGCKQKVKKLLQKMDGVYTTNIDSEQGKVTVSGNVDPATLIRKLRKAGKHAELWSAPKGGNMINNNKQINNQFQNMQLDNKKGQKDAKPPKGGGKDNQKNMPPLPPQMQHTQHQPKGFKDLKLPPLKGLKLPFNKDQKTVKFCPQEDEDFSDDEFDEEELDEDELDEFDDDFDDEVAIKPPSFKGIPMKPPMSGQVPVQGHPFMNVPPNPAMNGKGGGGNGNKNVQVPIKGGGNNNGKNDGGGKKGGGNTSGGNQNQNPNPNPNQHQNGSGGKNGGQNGGGNNKNAPNNMPNGGTDNNQHPQGGKKGGGGGGGGGGAPQKGVAGQGGFHEIDLRKNGGGGDIVGGPAGQMGYPGMPPAGNNMPAVQGMPMNAGGYFRPEMMAGGGGANPYQQQMLAQMMMQQQQRHNAGFQPMTYARPPPAVAYAPSPYMPPPQYFPPTPYMPPPQYCPPTPEYTHYFSDENTNSCSVM